MCNIVSPKIGYLIRKKRKIIFLIILFNYILSTYKIRNTGAMQCFCSSYSDYNLPKMRHADRNSRYKLSIQNHNLCIYGFSIESKKLFFII